MIETVIINKSDCCSAPVVVEGHTTHYYACTKCLQPCDVEKPDGIKENEMSDPVGKEPRLSDADRESVGWFAEEMVCKLAKNSHKAHWSTVDCDFLFARLKEEVEELYQAANGDIISECADVANFAMMIADNSRRMRDDVS